MTSKSFTVSDYHELLALHRALLEAKFCDEPNDLDISASPIISEMHKKLVKLLQEIEAGKNKDQVNHAWDEWLSIDQSRREWQVALTRARSERSWADWNEAQKKKYVYDLLSPFILDEEAAKKFIDSVR
ncbi:hypothetical protein [Hoeflea poritis]|uniref:Uncharacterized protein n=1 Tax=Hoeflea poritis TaxID=2993659 RepID=A0ABT4VW91_9HYPH|nr:hypothetical protein [Hoeflea poritis]MDA4848904.1 hypothetical protein [Hoeflea poritis]